MNPNWVSPILRKPLWWCGFAVFILAVPLGAQWVRHHRSSAPPHFGQLPTFSLKDQDGHSFNSSDLAGKIWVVDFIFTSCSEICPRLTAEMAKLQLHLVNRGADAQVRLLSITVDPERDTPERLKAYANGFSARPDRWTFATGSTADIQKTVVQGFKQALEKQPEGDGFSILHSGRFVLIDARGAMRGFYDTTQPEEISRLYGDLAALREGA